MALDISKEYEKFIAVANDNTFVEYINENRVRQFSLRINFLYEVLISTIKYPQIEPYLKDLLNNYTIDELENIYDNWTILHQVMYDAFQISVDAFEIIINFGVNINIKSTKQHTLAHVLFLNGSCNIYNNNILNLLIKHGIDLNIMNKFGVRVLDLVIENTRNLSEETKNCIMTLTHSGVTTSIEYGLDNEITEFIKSYKCSNIKPAIKK